MRFPEIAQSGEHRKIFSKGGPIAIGEADRLKNSQMRVVPTRRLRDRAVKACA
jgi:hypothetical protein